MKKRNLLLLAGLIGALVLLFSLAYAQTPDRPMKEKKDAWGLTDDQIEKMKEIQYNFTKTGIGLKADLKEARLELRHQMAQENTDKKEIAKLVDRVAEVEKMVLKHEVDRKLAVKEILTPEQFQKFLQKRGGMKREKMGRDGECCQQDRRDFGRHGDGPRFGR
jgi:Spy/CpxP family protein refolding chaperone